MRQQLVSRFFALTASLTLLASASAQLSNIRINEFLADNGSFGNVDGSFTDLLEFHNAGPIAVDLGGCSLTDLASNPRRAVFPPGTSVPAGGFRVIRMDSGLPVTSSSVNFGIRASGGFLYLFDPGSVLIDSVEYGLQVQDLTIGRVPDGSGAWQLNIPTLQGANTAYPNLAPRSVLKVNEWMANPSSGNKDYIEIYNPTNLPVPIGGMYLTDQAASPTKFRVPELSYIGTGWISGFRRFVADGSTTTPKYPADELNFALSGNGEAVGIYDTNGASIDFRTFGAQVNGVSQGLLPDGSPNVVSFPKINDYDTASPGEPNFLIFTNLYINELLAHTDLPLEDAIEFINTAGTNQNISGWWLSNSRRDRKRYRIPTGPALVPGGFRVIYEGTGTGTGFNTPSAVLPFTFNSSQGDQAVLSQVDANGNLTGYIAFEDFEASANGVSFGHYNTSVPGDYKFVAMAALTFGVTDPNFVTDFRQGTGQANSAPRVGPLVINEIMFAPSNTVYVDATGITVTGQNPAEEYIEIRNITSTPVPLYDPQYPTNHWRIQQAVDFVFPQTTIGPNEFFLVVGFDPTANPGALANFRSRFGVSNTVPIFGPWGRITTSNMISARLNDSSDAVELYRPDPVQLPPHPDAGFVPYIRIDKVNYSSGAPWPGGAVATGRSLQRKNSLRFGNDPLNWAVDAPNPGRASIALQDSDGDGITDVWETANGLLPNNSTDADDDPDNDGVTNLGEYVGGTNPHDGTSRLTIAQVVPYQGTNVAIRFLAYSNTTYSVEYRNSLLTPNWQKVGDVASEPVNRMVEVPDLTAYRKADRYYRVVAPSTE
jgi:hypothetical protein